MGGSDPDGAGGHPCPGGCNDCLDAPAGASGFYPRISVDISRNNLWGLAHSISLRTQFSTLQQRALLNYSWPHFEDNDKLSLSFTGLADNSKDIRTYNYTRLEGSAQLSQRLTRATTLLYRLAFCSLGTPGFTRTTERSESVSEEAESAQYANRLSPRVGRFINAAGTTGFPTGKRAVSATQLM